MAALPKCDDCGFRFDPKDPRARKPTEYGARCALCEAFYNGTIWSPPWAMKNDCNGLFDDQIYFTKAEAEADWDSHSPIWREWRNACGEPDGKVVPVVVIEIPENHPAYFRAMCENQEREEQNRDYEARLATDRGRIIGALQSYVEIGQ
jgi:hypothetical protein